MVGNSRKIGVHPASSTPDDGQSPVPNPIDSWYLLSEDSKDSTNDEDIEAGRPKDDGSNAVYLQAKALYAYTADPEDPNEVSFAKGEILEVVHGEGKWWQVKKSSRQVGIAPSNFLKVLENEYDGMKPVPFEAKAISASDPEEPHKISFAKDDHMTPMLFPAKALYAYTADPEDPHEISFAEGEILGIIDNSGKWWQAKNASGQVGMAPSNFLQIL